MRRRQVRGTVGPVALACLLAVSIGPTMAKGLARKSKADPMLGPEAVARYEFAKYRKVHPQADLAVVFSDHPFANAQQAELRRRLGFNSPKPREVDELVTIRFDRPGKASKRLDASVLYGRVGRGGFRAHYTLKKAGRKLVVADQNVFLRY